MERLIQIMRRLRSPEGCPWDRAQTHESLRSHLLEEAGEAVDAISLGHWEELPGELGDVLLQVAFHAVIAEEDARFTYQDIENSICEKMIRRHPHVYGDVQADTPKDVVRNWNAIKAQEQGREKHPLERIPNHLGALEREFKVQETLAEPVLCKEDVIAILADCSDTSDGVVQVLRAVVSWARQKSENPELMLRAAVAETISKALDDHSI
ncbi:MAG: MazG family protein [Deinococcaceae bacterium]